MLLVERRRTRPDERPADIVSQNVNGVEDRPGGVAPWSETLAAAHTSSFGNRPRPSIRDTRSGSS